MQDQIRKYPRTAHVEGSALQDGDHDLARVGFSHLAGREVVYEEKVDGSNAAFFFDGSGAPHAQSRGHELDLDRRGGRERHFNLFKDWVKAHADRFLARLEDRYIVYGEWLFATHTVHYDRLPHWFLEFDILDRHRDVFLATDERAALLAGLPIVSVPVLYRGPARTRAHLESLVGRSLYKGGDWRAALDRAILRGGFDLERTRALFEDDDRSEGLYIKVEEGGVVRERYKWVRSGFLQRIKEADSHWQSRPIVPNGLADGVSIFVDGGGGEA